MHFSTIVALPVNTSPHSTCTPLQRIPGLLHCFVSTHLKISAILFFVFFSIKGEYIIVFEADKVDELQNLDFSRCLENIDRPTDVLRVFRIFIELPKLSRPSNRGKNFPLVLIQYNYFIDN